jgi:hypothetical protein
MTFKIGLARGLSCFVPLAPLFSAVAALSSTPHPLTAQDEREVEWRTTCQECDLVIDSVFTLSAQVETAGLVDAVWTVARDNAGRYWASFAGADVPRVYSEHGIAFGSIGRGGEGPGEFRSVLGIVPVADSVLLFDPMLQRMTVVNRDLQAVRFVSVQGQVFRGVALDWPRIVVNAQIHTSGAVGYPFHILNIETGMIESSFGGAARGDYAPQDKHAILGYIVKDPATGELWTAMRTQFRVQKWSQQGQLIETFTGLRNLIPISARGLRGSPNRPPDGVVNAITTGKDGILYLAIQAPSRTWRSAWPDDAPTSAAGHPLPNQMPDPVLLYDLFVAAMDPATGNILTIRQLEYDAMLDAHVPSGFLAFAGSTDLFPTLATLAVSLNRFP